MGSYSISENSIKIIETLIGREISNCIEVVKTCPHGIPHGIPQVIKSYPIKDNKPFPTLYWLVCPYLCEEVAKLESKGMITYFEELIEKNSEFKKKMFMAHCTEIRVRLEILGEAITDLSPSMQSKMRNTGIGGITDFSKVKCLHLHLASFLGGQDNPVGAEVSKMIDSCCCSDFACEKYIR